MEIKIMTDEQRKAVALEYLKRLDRGEAFFELFDDHAEVYFPEMGDREWPTAVREAIYGSWAGCGQVQT